MTKRNYTEKEAAEVYGPSVAWFRRKRWEGDGPAFVKLSGMVLYPVNELESFFKSRLRRSTSDPGPTQQPATETKQTAKIRQIKSNSETPSVGLSHEQGQGGAEQ